MNSLSFIRLSVLRILFFFFNDTATTEIYTLSLHDALPISRHGPVLGVGAVEVAAQGDHQVRLVPQPADRRDVRRAGHQARVVGRQQAAPAEGGDHGGGQPPGRSEERRVGKECRSRWSTYH